jgi:hypothetical protein
MRIRFVMLLAVFAALSTPAAGELVHGTVDLSSCIPGFDFSQQSCAGWPCAYDLVIYRTRPPVPFPFQVVTCFCGDDFGICYCDAPAVVTKIPDATLEEVEWAPEDSTAYACEQWVFEKTVYVIHTFDGVYAKFVFTDLPTNEHKIDYVVQTDGSRRLGGVPVAHSTWGKIKELYE